MSKLEINWSQAEYECEDCGVDTAIGAEVFLDGKLIVSKKAVAHCYNGSGDIDITGILLIALEKLGVEITQTGEPGEDLQWCKDTCYEYKTSFYNGEERIEYIKL